LEQKPAKAFLIVGTCILVLYVVYVWHTRNYVLVDFDMPERWLWNMGRLVSGLCALVLAAVVSPNVFSRIFRPGSYAMAFFSAGVVAFLITRTWEPPLPYLMPLIFALVSGLFGASHANRWFACVIGLAALYIQFQLDIMAFLLVGGKIGGH
jgi:hypothetical protein